MLKRENRLVRGVRFNNSHSFSTPQFVLKERKNGLMRNRFGIVVSKKIDKRAVVRNNLKRFLRTSLTNLDRKMSHGYDMLFITKKEILGKTKEENLLAIENALEKAGFMKTKGEK